MPRRQAQERPSRLKTRLQTPTSIFTVKLPALPHRETASPATSSRVRACHAGAPPHKGILPPVTPLVLGTRRFGPTRIRQPPEASPAAPPAPCRCPPPAVSFFTAFRRRAHPTSAAVTRGLAATCPAQVLAGPRRAPSRHGSESRAIAAGRSHGVAYCPVLTRIWRRAGVTAPGFESTDPRRCSSAKGATRAGNRPVHQESRLLTSAVDLQSRLETLCPRYSSVALLPQCRSSESPAAVAGGSRPAPAAPPHLPPPPPPHTPQPTRASSPAVGLWRRRCGRAAALAGCESAPLQTRVPTSRLAASRRDWAPRPNAGPCCPAPRLRCQRPLKRRPSTCVMKVLVDTGTRPRRDEAAGHLRPRPTRGRRRRAPASAAGEHKGGGPLETRRVWTLGSCVGL